jgi:hypothetical protein
MLTAAKPTRIAQRRRIPHEAQMGLSWRNALLRLVGLAGDMNTLIVVVGARVSLGWPPLCRIPPLIHVPRLNSTLETPDDGD